MHLLVVIQKLFASRPLGPEVAKNYWKWLQMLVSDHYLKKYSHNPIQSSGVHFLGEPSELICFWATLAKFWPSGGHLWISIPACQAGTCILWCLIPFVLWLNQTHGELLICL